MSELMTILFGWVAVYLIVTIISVVFFGDNMLFRISESILIGATVGNLVVISLQTLKTGALLSIMQGKILYFIPLSVGILLFARFTKYSWLARYGVALLVGVGFGVSIRALVYSQLIVQIQSAIGDLSTGINGILSFVIVLCVISYFMFTFTNQQKYIAPFSKLGRISMMIAFGAGYVSLLVGVFSQIINNIHKIIDVLYATFI